MTQHRPAADVGAWKRGDVARSTIPDVHLSDATAGSMPAIGRAGAALKPPKRAGSKHDRIFSATKSAVATRAARVESKDKKGTKERFGTEVGAAATVIRDFCIKNGVMVRAVRDIIIMSPPLVITHAEIDKIFATIRRALDESGDALRALQ